MSLSLCTDSHTGSYGEHCRVVAGIKQHIIHTCIFFQNCPSSSSTLQCTQCTVWIELNWIRNGPILLIALGIFWQYRLFPTLLTTPLSLRCVRVSALSSIQVHCPLSILCLFLLFCSGQDFLDHYHHLAKHPRETQCFVFSLDQTQLISRSFCLDDF